MWTGCYSSLLCHLLDHSQQVLLRQQAEEVVAENEQLKMVVHKLNIQLSRYQAKHSPPQVSQKYNRSLSVSELSTLPLDVANLSDCNSCIGDYPIESSLKHMTEIELISVSRRAILPACRLEAGHLAG